MTSSRWWTTGHDYIDLLYWPYTLMFMAFGGIGAFLSPSVNWNLLPFGMLILFLGVGVMAHCLDELKGHPLGTSIPDSHLWIGAIFSGLLICITAIYLTIFYSPFIFPLFIIAAFFVVAYNYELFKGQFHNDIIFIFGFGFIPQFIGYYVSSLQFPPLSMLIVFSGLAASCGVETTINHFVKWNSNYQLSYDSEFDYLQRGVWAAVWMPSIVCIGLLLWRLNL